MNESRDQHPFYHVQIAYDVPKLPEEMPDALRVEMIALHQVALVFSQWSITRTQAKRILAFFSDAI